MRPFLLITLSTLFVVAQLPLGPVFAAEDTASPRPAAVDKKQSNESKRKSRPRKTAGDKNPAFKPVTDVPGLPRVLLIGDSISIGYTPAVQKLLQGKANVHRIPMNGGPTSSALQYLDKELNSGKWDLVHFNWGLHDLKVLDGKTQQVPLDQYEKNLTKLVKRLQESGATLVWCSTTPVPAKVSPVRSNEDVNAYNAVAQKIMEANQIAIDDLYGYALPKLKEIQRPNNVHFTADGSAILAEQVASSIEKAITKPTAATGSKSAP